MLCDDLEAGGGGKGGSRGKGYIYIQIVDSHCYTNQQKPTQYCKVIILQLKIKHDQMDNQQGSSV